MPYTLAYDPEADLIVGSIQGAFNTALVQDYFRAVLTLAREKNCTRVLTDMRNSKPRMTVLEIDDLPRFAADLGLTPMVRRALVVADDFEDYAFYRSSSVIRKQNVRIFTDMDAAKAWLFGEEADDQ